MGRIFLRAFLLFSLFTIIFSFPAGLSARVPKSSGQLQLEEGISALKKQDSPGNISKILTLNSQLEQMTGMNHTTSPSYNGAVFRGAAPLPPFAYNPDFVNNTKIFSNPGEIRGVAACIEQRGATAGKIWLCVVYSAGNTSPDSLKIYYSANNAVSWSLFGSGNIRPLDKISPGDLDMEIIENTAGQKYLWITYGYRQNGGTGAWMTGGFVLQEPSINAYFFNSLNWPGADSTKRYYNIRVTSDNARYLSTSWLYMICSFDSLSGAGIHVNSQKFARCLNPYTVSGVAFSYMGRDYFRSDGTGSAGYQRTVYSDICYFNNGGADSVEVSYSGSADSTKIYFAKGDIDANPPVSYTGSGGPVGGSEPGDMKDFASISSNGNDNGSVVCVFRQFTGGLWREKWFLTDNYGNFNNIFSESTAMGSGGNPNYAPDVVSVRNGSAHYMAFTTKAAIDSVHYLTINSNGTFSENMKMNYYTASELQGPKALFRYQAGDSCLVLYADSSSHALYSAAGCSGDPIGIRNLSSIASRFSLSQNYPNPFNPVTRINFTIASVGQRHVFDTRLMVYDILGKEVAALINQPLSPGSYEVTFDGTNLATGVYFYKLESGDFTEVKKMLMVK